MEVVVLLGNLTLIISLCRSRYSTENDRQWVRAMPIETLRSLYVKETQKLSNLDGDFTFTSRQNATPDSVCYMVTGIGKNKISVFMKSIN